jgi:hypothetical protein
VPPGHDADQRATELLFLLLLKDLDSPDAVKAALANARLKTALLEKAAPWAVVAPGRTELAKLRKAVAGRFTASALDAPRRVRPLGPHARRVRVRTRRRRASSPTCPFFAERMTGIEPA